MHRREGRGKNISVVHKMPRCLLISHKIYFVEIFPWTYFEILTFMYRNFIDSYYIVRCMLYLLASSWFYGKLSLIKYNFNILFLNLLNFTILTIFELQKEIIPASTIIFYSMIHIKVYLATFNKKYMYFFLLVTQS